MRQAHCRGKVSTSLWQSQVMGSWLLFTVVYLTEASLHAQVVCPGWGNNYGRGYCLLCFHLSGRWDSGSKCKCESSSSAQMQSSRQFTFDSSTDADGYLDQQFGVLLGTSWMQESIGAAKWAGSATVQQAHSVPWIFKKNRLRCLYGIIQCDQTVNVCLSCSFPSVAGGIRVRLKTCCSDTK